MENPEDAWMRGSWDAFEKILNWINTQDQKRISKGDLYNVVINFRPSPYKLPMGKIK